MGTPERRECSDMFEFFARPNHFCIGHRSRHLVLMLFLFTLFDQRVLVHRDFII